MNSNIKLIKNDGRHQTARVSYSTRGGSQGSVSRALCWSSQNHSWSHPFPICTE